MGEVEVLAPAPVQLHGRRQHHRTLEDATRYVSVDEPLDRRLAVAVEPERVIITVTRGYSQLIASLESRNIGFGKSGRR